MSFRPPKPLSRIVFDKFDQDGNGWMSREELRSLCLEMGYLLTDEELVWALSILDKDGSGKIDYQEFSDWWKSSSRFEKLQSLDEEKSILLGRIVKIFKDFDTNNKGSLSGKEFDEFFKRLVEEQIVLEDNRSAHQFDEIDRQNDRKINFNELIAWLRDISVL